MLIFFTLNRKFNLIVKLEKRRLGQTTYILVSMLYNYYILITIEVFQN